MQNTVRAVTLAGLLLLAPSPAFAYIDPGTGSMLLQSLLAAVAVAAVGGRTAWNKIKEFFRRGKSRDLDS